MLRDCRKVLVFERGVFGAKFAEATLAGMEDFSDWPYGSPERYALLL